MSGYQQLLIVGNVGRDVEFKYTLEGVAVASFSVAVTRKLGRLDSTERREVTTWFRVSAWRQLAEIANQYVRKGDKIMIIGRVEARAYVDKSGQLGASLDVTADEITLLGSRQEPGSTSARGSIIEDVPF